MTPEKLGYETLESEVIAAGRCCSCGGCVAACPINVIELKDLQPTLVGECTRCGLCLKTCPRMITDYTPLYTQVFGDHADRDPALGVYRKAYALRNADEYVRKRAQDGGIVTGLLIHLLESTQIDGAIISGIDPDKPWRPVPLVATTREELIAGAKSRYTRSANLLALREAVKERKLEKLAMVGTPCHIQAIQRMRLAPLKKFDRAIVFTIGLFCSETFDFEKLMLQKIVNEMQIPLEQLRKLDIKGKLLVFPRGAKESLKIPLKEAKNWVEEGCHHCRDFASDFADISVGSAGTPSKWSTVLARTEKGEELIEELIRNGSFLHEEVSSDGLDTLRRIAAPKTTH